jgi:hypothetical protein
VELVKEDRRERLEIRHSGQRVILAR